MTLLLWLRYAVLAVLVVTAVFSLAAARDGD
jgi:hypothetical protein